MRRILFLIALMLIFSGCQKKSSFKISGTISGDLKKYISISRIDVNTPVLIDSAKIKKNGTFSLKVKATEADFYQLGYSSSDFITLLAEPGEKIRLVFKGSNLFENYSVSGSSGSEKVSILDQTLNVTKRKLDSLSTLYDKVSNEAGFETRGPELEAEFGNIIKAQRKKSIEFILSNLSSLASLKAIYQRINSETYVLYDPRDLQYLKIVNDSLSRYYPNSKHVQALSRDFEKEMNQMYVDKLQQETKNLPAIELDPDLKTIEGKRIALSSLKGRYVLLAFWSVRSKDCITENLQLKEYYRQYKKKGFEIYQINVDESESDWRSAVRFDELPWISTREDDPLKPRNAMLFNVKKLPANYLFDKEGNIIASDLHGRSLKLKLEQLFKD